MNKGFSLVELAIVVAIIGLIAGGVVVGGSMVRSADLKAQTHQIGVMTKAVNQFKSEYRYLPGDYPHATDNWGAQHTTPATCRTTASTGKLTCDGNGDGTIGSATYEMYRAWQHLANAGLLEGQYTGVQAGTVLGHSPQNAPSGTIKNTLWSIRYFPTFSNSNWWNLGEDYGNIMQLGGEQSTTINEADIFTPEEVASIDSKIDDGRPATGRLLVFDWTNCTDATAATDLDSDYDFTVNSLQCSIILRNFY